MKTLTIAAAIAALSTSAFAGGLSPEVVEAPVVAAEAPPEPGSSINPTLVVVGVLAALLIASAVAEDDEDDEPML